MADFYIKVLDEERGPFSGKEIATMAANGEIQPDFLIRKGEGDWKIAANVQGLKFGPRKAPIKLAEVQKPKPKKPKPQKQAESSPVMYIGANLLCWFLFAAIVFGSIVAIEASNTSGRFDSGYAPGATANAAGKIERNSTWIIWLLVFIFGLGVSISNTLRSIHATLKEKQVRP